jgi:hypothetical protein
VGQNLLIIAQGPTAADAERCPQGLLVERGAYHKARDDDPSENSFLFSIPHGPAVHYDDEGRP